MTIQEVPFTQRDCGRGKTPFLDKAKSELLEGIQGGEGHFCLLPLFRSGMGVSASADSLGTRSYHAVTDPLRFLTD